MQLACSVMRVSTPHFAETCQICIEIVPYAGTERSDYSNWHIHIVVERRGRCAALKSINEKVIC
jgi:hypothetical protein